MMITIGVVGCGTIGSFLVRQILRRYKSSFRLVGVCEPDEKKVARLERSLKQRIGIYPLKVLAKKSQLLIEAAAAHVAKDVVEQAVVFGKDVMVMSVGGLLLHQHLLKKAYKKKIKLYIPSGAIAGLDALKAARKGAISSVKLITKKPIAGLQGAEYIRNNKIDLHKIKKEKIIFNGSALEAVAGFPKNINVAAILSLGGLGAKKTRVCIVASRLTKRNTHTLEIEGNFGKIVCCTENLPSRLNPKTSMLAILSALATLDGILNDIKIGT